MISSFRIPLNWEFYITWIMASLILKLLVATTDLTIVVYSFWTLGFTKSLMVLKPFHCSTWAALTSSWFILFFLSHNLRRKVISISESNGAKGFKFKSRLRVFLIYQRILHQNQHTKWKKIKKVSKSNNTKLVIKSIFQSPAMTLKTYSKLCKRTSCINSIKYYHLIEIIRLTIVIS